MFKETGKYLKAKRIEIGITQTELQHFLGYGGKNGYVSRVEMGRAMYGVSRLKRIIPKLNLNSSYLIELYCRDVLEITKKKLGKLKKIT